MDTSDAHLLLLSQQDNGLAFRQLYDRHWKRLYLFSLKLLKDETEAKDVVQEVFFTLWSKRKELQIKDTKAYLFATTKYRCLESLRRKRLDTTFLDKAHAFFGENNVEKEIQKYNAKVASSNNVLKGAMQDYPFKYELVEYDGDDKKLYNAGYQYVLLNLNTTGYTIREMLNYEVDKNETDYITMKTSNGKTILRTIPVHAPVYKFYVKHLVTGDVYLGTKWDADETMDEALKNYIQNFKDELKIR
jgi:RNA polymerase sigma factor (sigma-70 family)